MARLKRKAPDLVAPKSPSIWYLGKGQVIPKWLPAGGLEAVNLSADSPTTMSVFAVNPGFREN